MPDQQNWALLLYRLDRMEAQIEDLEKKFEDRSQERDAQERRQLMAGITFLGAMVMTLFGLIWSYRSVIFRDQ